MKVHELIEQLQKLIAEHPEAAECSMFVIGCTFDPIECVTFCTDKDSWSEAPCVVLNTL